MKRLLTVGLTMAFTLFSTLASAKGEDAFWKWFTKNEARLFTFEKDQEAVFDELHKRMMQVNEDLTFEFGPVQEGKREFVISAGGIKAAFPAVEALHSGAPRRKLDHSFSVGDMTLNKPLVQTRTGEAPVLAAQRRRWASMELL